MSSKTVPQSQSHAAYRPAASRVPVLRAAAAAVVAFALLNVGWLALKVGGVWASRAFSDIAGCVCAGLVAVASFYAWKSETPRRRRGWGLMSLAGTLWFCGEVTWTVYELILKRAVPFPSAADAAYLAGYVLAALAMVVLPAAATHLMSGLRTLLDGVLVGGSLLFVGWATFLGPIYRGESGTFLEKAIGLAYPIFDIVIVATVLLVVARAQPERRTSLVLLGAGLLALAAADSSFAYMTLIKAYRSGGPMDAAWNIGYLLMALAALRHDPTVPRPERSEKGLGLALPYLAVTLAVVVAGVKLVQHGSVEPLLFWGTLTMVLLVIVRQLVTLLDNVSLARNLEQKVQERTAALARSEERHRSLVQHSSDVVTIVDASGIVRYQSESIERILGYRPDDVLGRAFLDYLHPDDRPAGERFLVRYTSEQGTSPTIEWRLRHADGEWRACESIGTNLLADTSVGGFVLNTRDVSERKALETQLRHQAFHDQLTGLANRALFREHAEQALKRATRERRPIAVVYFDLDDLKKVNDGLGHEAGDQLIRAAAQRLKSCLRGADTIARIGGDEFCVLLADCEDELAAELVAERLLSALREPFTIGSSKVRSGASIGIAMNGEGIGIDELLRHADLAMYAAKRGGKGRVERYKPAQDATLLDR